MATRAHSTGAPAMPLAPISSNIIRYNPGGCPAGIEPRLWRKALSRRVQVHLALATALLGLLDRLDGDFDLEDNGDLEPSIGGSDLELDGCDDEPSLGSPEIDALPSVWRSKTGFVVFQANQERWANGSGYSEEEAVNEDGDELDSGEGDPAEYDSGDTIEGGGSGKL